MKLNSYELSAPLERVVPGLGGPVYLEIGLNKAKRKFGVKPKLSGAVATVFTSVRKAKVFADFEMKFQKVKLQKSEGFCR